MRTFYNFAEEHIFFLPFKRVKRYRKVEEFEE